MNGDDRKRLSGVTAWVRRVAGVVGRSAVARSVSAVPCLALLGVCLSASSVAAAAEDAEFLARVKADTQWLTSYGTRQVGTPAHATLQNDLLAKLRSVPGVKVWTDEFPVVVPVHEATYLEIAGGTWAGRHPILPLWPDGARLNTTPTNGIDGRLIYIGDGEYDRLPARSLQGNIAVMELSASANFRQAFDFSAVAVIFLESSKAGVLATAQTSFYKPRYYVSAGPLAEALRANAVAAGRIVSRSRWDTVTARNLYVGVNVPGTKGVAPYAVVAPYDSMSVLMGDAPGADSALDCATVLNLLRDVAAQPPRPLLFGFVDAYHINQAGMRRMAAMLTETTNELTRAAYQKLEQDDLETYQAAAKELARFDSVTNGLAALGERGECEQLRRMFKDAVGRDLLRLRELQGDLRLAAARRDAESAKPAVRQQMLEALTKSAGWLLNRCASELTPAERAQLEAARTFAVAETDKTDDEIGGAVPWAGFPVARDWAKTLLPVCSKPLQVRNRILNAALSTGRSVLAEDLSVAGFVWDEMAVRVRGQLEEQEQRAAFFEPLDRLRGEIVDHFALNSNGTGRATCAFVVGLDLSDCGVLVGPGTQCSFNRVQPTDRDFARALKRAVLRGEVWPAGSPERRAVNIGGIEGRVGGGGDLGQRALITSVSVSFRLPGVTWVTDDAPRQRADSPLDRFDRLDWSRIGPQLAATRRWLDWLFTTSDYVPNSKLAADKAANWRHGMGRIVDISAGETVPRVPRRGFLVTLLRYNADQDGIRRLEFAWTGHDGSFRLPLQCAELYREGFFKQCTMAAFKLDGSGAIVESLTTAESMTSTRLATSFSLASKPGDQLPRAVTFECVELNGPSFFDARFLEPLRVGTLLDAVRGGKPKQSSFSIDTTGQMWGLVKPGMRWELTVGAGAGDVRMVLLNSVPDGRQKGLDLRRTFQRGYAVDERLSTIPARLSATDLYALNDWRLADYRAAGIRSEKIDEIRARTRGALDAAAAAAAADDGAGLQRAAVRAQASEIRAYAAVWDTGQDIARGAIFLMLMLVPFCVAMERLVFACARIGAQISAAVAIFAAMTALLWSFHPAFRISAQPLVIVMAFTILAMSVAVIYMVLDKFRSAVREFQSSLAEGSGAQMGRGGLIGSAVFLGIANMRKRKVRTALTGATIVLVTFALLCFSSASSYVDKKEFRLDNAKAQRPSVMVRRPSLGPIPPAAAAGIGNLLGRTNDTIGTRSWLAPGLGATEWRIWLVNPVTGKQVPVRAALGLPPIEDRLSGVDAVLPNWTEFAAQGGCYLPADAAEQLGVKVGDRVVVRGLDLVLRGVFDPAAMEDRVALLDGQRLMPYDYSRQEMDWVSRDSQAAVEKETESASALQPPEGNRDRYVPARDTIVLPADSVAALGGTLRSVAVACASPDEAAKVAHQLMETIVYPAYYANAQGGVNVVVATPLMALPPKNLAVPLVIAALIIFTTMLNSVSERKKEIYVYTSLGLAPVHIGALFVAEALTYGLMGAVFGYIAGQGAAKGLTYLGWMQGVTLNYSGTAVIKTMLLVQAVVVLSAIVPAIVAGRIAAPSTEMDWRVPVPVDGVIRDTLPFTVSPAAAPGLVAFIHEYLEAHRDGVLGGFDVDDVRLLPRSDGCVAGLETRLWLAPFDMGVRQQMRLTVELPTDGVCGIAVEIRHETGMPKVWWRLNRPFFYDLRRQMLGWRKVTPERVREYVERMRNAENGMRSAV